MREAALGLRSKIVGNIKANSSPLDKTPEAPRCGQLQLGLNNIATKVTKNSNSVLEPLISESLQENIGMRNLGEESGSLGITRCNGIGSTSLGIFVNGIHEAARCE